MQKKKYRQGHAGRLQAGAVVLSAAKSVDTTCVATRLTAFAQAQAAYAAAQRAVDETQARITSELVNVADEDAALKIVLNKLVLALLNDRQPRLSPFVAFGAPSPSALMRLHYDEKPMAMRKLIAAIRRNELLSKDSQEAATLVESAVAVLEKAAAPIALLHDALTEARSDRDALSDRWDEALASLKRGAQAGIDEGAPGLYAALFGRASNRAKQRRSQTATVSAEIEVTE